MKCRTWTWVRVWWHEMFQSLRTIDLCNQQVFCVRSVGFHLIGHWSTHCIYWPNTPHHVGLADVLSCVLSYFELIFKVWLRCVVWTVGQRHERHRQKVTLHVFLWWVLFPPSQTCCYSSRWTHAALQICCFQYHFCFPCKDHTAVMTSCAWISILFDSGTTFLSTSHTSELCSLEFLFLIKPLF